MKARRSFTLLELIMVVIIIGILAGISLPLYTKAKERTFDQEAIANLKLMQAAEKIYHMETGEYYGSGVIGDINKKLKLALPSGDQRNWDYECYSNNGCVEAERITDSRDWRLLIGDEEPINQTCP